MYQLAMDYGNGPISLKYIAEQQGLSENYLEQLFSNLRKDKLLKSVRGAQGGYLLIRRPSEISVGEVLRSLEGSLAPAECTEHGGDCTRHDTCATKTVLTKIKDSIDTVVDSITLQDMLDDDICNK